MLLDKMPSKLLSAALVKSWSMLNTEEKIAYILRPKVNGWNDSSPEFKESTEKVY